VSALTAKAARQSRDIEILARTLHAEAGRLPVRAIEALAALVANRVRTAALADGPKHWGQGFAGVCRAPFQFPCWNRNDPRYAALFGPPDANGLDACRRVAARAVGGVLRDPTGGATHWHAAERLPGWAVGRVANAEIGGLVFYRLEG
jgi:spore germination cell wall hydrolase CwlJ-like protein